MGWKMSKMTEMYNSKELEKISWIRDPGCRFAGKFQNVKKSQKVPFLTIFEKLKNVPGSMIQIWINPVICSLSQGLLSQKKIM